MELTEDVRCISGVEVHFPYKPYPSQISMMAKIIAGLKNRQNCLLESPTGSGKSLALLCSALAWQRTQYELAAKEELERSEYENGHCTCDTSMCTSRLENDLSDRIPTVSPHFQTTAQPPSTVVPPWTSIPAQNTPAKILASLAAQSKGVVFEDDDFKDCGKKFRTPGSKQTISHAPVKIVYDSTVNLDKVPEKDIVQMGKQVSSVPQPMEVDPMPTKPGSAVPSNLDKSSTSPCVYCQSLNKSPPPQKRKVPKIYFGTRTHKQITQIVRELGKTHYQNAKMTILASREHTCIHPTVSLSSGKSEGCRDLLDGPGCTWNNNTRKISSQHALKNFYGKDSAWDIEDLVTLCSEKRVKACPYYVSRGLRSDSDIIFCPYNYLVDPIIRKTMEINLKDEIIILDEAHNIEDSAREAVSQSIEQDNMVKIIKELTDLVNHNVKPFEHQLLLNMCTRLDEFVLDSGSKIEQSNFDQASTVLSGMDIVARLVGVGLGPKDFPELKRVLAAVTEDDDSEKRRDGGVPSPRLTVGMANVLEALFTVLDFLYREELRFVEDYRVAIVRSMSYSQSMADTSGQWLNTRKKGRKQMRQVFTLHFWCLNPAVAFSDFTVVRNIVLTSGTLSPMSSFSSELGMAFPISLEANHVIKNSQVWVGSIGEGPAGGKLQATYKNTETFSFQDELGHLVLEVCKAVPHGVLCFLPSYKMLEKLSERWKLTGLWGKILGRKKIIAEPRRGDKADFDDLLKYFYGVIKGESDCSDEDYDEGDDSCIDGALFLAVCRGKVSEGLDFADNNARAVITVGIPFPNFKDTQVELKRKYNDRYSSVRGLLSGSEWYEIQAYRALNQALGRCIRHRNDWGALIMIDDRFVRQPQRYNKGLSKWVRNKACSFSSFKVAMESLKTFTKGRIQHDENNASDTSGLPTSQGTDSSAFETPLKTGVKKNGEQGKGDNQSSLLTPLKQLTSTPLANLPKVELSAVSSLGCESPPMSLPYKDKDHAYVSLIDTPSSISHPNKEEGSASSGMNGSSNSSTLILSDVKKSSDLQANKSGVHRFFQFCKIPNSSKTPAKVGDNEQNYSNSCVKQQGDAGCGPEHKTNNQINDRSNNKAISPKTDNKNQRTELLSEKKSPNFVSNCKSQEDLHSSADIFEDNSPKFKMETDFLQNGCHETENAKPIAKRPLFRKTVPGFNNMKAKEDFKHVWIDSDFEGDSKEGNGPSNKRKSNSNCEENTSVERKCDLNDSNKASDQGITSSKCTLNKGDKSSNVEHIACTIGKGTSQANGPSNVRISVSNSRRATNDEKLSPTEDVVTRRKTRATTRRAVSKRERYLSEEEPSKRRKAANETHFKETDDKIICSHCGSVVITDLQGADNDGRVPTFVQRIGSQFTKQFLNNGKPTEDLELIGSGSTENTNLNILRNSYWCEENQCCVQYYKCRTCPFDGGFIVIKVVCANEHSIYQTGMMWVLTKDKS